MAAREVVHLQSEKEEIESLVRENAAMERKLAGIGGEDTEVLLGLCADLEDIIEGISEISAKKDTIGHAAFETKVKFSHKLRRKSKDVGRFEQTIVREFDAGHISLEHGKKMAEVLKLLKSNDISKAVQKAEEFRGLLSTNEELKLNWEMLLKKRAQVERGRREIAAKLSDVEWLEKEAAPDSEKIGRHEARMRLLGEIRMLRAKHAGALSSMPQPQLLEKAKQENLAHLGFPSLSESEAVQLLHFLNKEGMGSKTAAQLLEMCSFDQTKLRHVLPDPAGFRREVGARKAYLEQIASLDKGGFLADDSDAGRRQCLSHLASQFPEAAQIAASLDGLEKTAGGDAQEWERSQEISFKKAGLAGMDKHGLQKKLHELQSIQNILDGKKDETPAHAEAKGKKQEKGKNGILGWLLGLFSGR